MAFKDVISGVKNFFTKKKDQPTSRGKASGNTGGGADGGLAGPARPTTTRNVASGPHGAAAIVKPKEPKGPKAPTVPRTTTRRSTGGRSGGGSSPKVTTSQRRAAKNLGAVAGYNADSTRQQLGRTLDTFAVSDQQNEAQAKTQHTQNSRNSAGERFAQLKKLQSSASAVSGAMGNAANGSGRRVLGEMLRSRNDMDSADSTRTLRSNQEAVSNALTEARNANTLAARNAASDAEYGLRGIESDTASQLNNIDPSLFVKPGTKSANLKSKGVGGRVSRAVTPGSYKESQAKGVIKPPAPRRKK